ncbi:class I SAM-dependent methyltransferase [Cerasicoccus frondis]|uniref:class I SAM-dependent methyltransferase n=1 Tax=Cerasicoccus frondis TaxID=490090 RepID=UPI002852C6A6|nr:class I SAM-dependent methyltransferase [Cerasicoccus frondis]
MLSPHQYLACLSHVLSDAAIGLCGMVGLSLVTSGRRHQRYSLEKSASYIEDYVTLFEDLLGGPGSFHGHVCELGPGDSLGGGVLYRLRGAASVTFLERFQRQESEREKKICELIYQREIDRKSSTEQSNSATQSLNPITNTFQLIQGVTAESHLRVDTTTYDLILSNSVIQHTTDPLPLLQLCYDRLKPGGRMLHVIDLRNLGILKQWGELAWLETPPALHRRMVRHTGRPNRTRFKDYRNWAESTGGKMTVRIRHLVGSDQHWGDVAPTDIPEDAWSASRELVREARPRFTPIFRSHSTRDHAVATFVFIVEKPE